MAQRSIDISRNTGVSDSLAVAFDKVEDNFDDLYLRVLPGGTTGWRDMVGQITPAPLGPANPAWTQMGSSAFYGYVFQVNDHIQVMYHFQHDYKPGPGSDIYMHAHWTTNGTSTNPVTWQMTWTYAKGYDQGNFGIVAGGTVETVTQEAAGTAWRHMIAEIAVPISSDDFEVDGLLMVQYKRVVNPTSPARANADTVFLLTADCHYETDRLNTAEKNYPFY